MQQQLQGAWEIMKLCSEKEDKRKNYNGMFVAIL